MPASVPTLLVNLTGLVLAVACWGELCRRRGWPDRVAVPAGLALLGAAAVLRALF